MIATPKPGTEAGRILEELRYWSADGLSLADFADRLHPRPRLESSSGPHYRAWRAAMVQWQAEAEQRRARVSVVLGRLRALGLVTPGRGDLTVADDVPDPMTPEWWGRRLWAVAEIDDDADDYTPGADLSPGGTACTIVARIRAGARGVTAAVGGSGHERETYAALVHAGVVISPSTPRITEAGIALVQSWYNVSNHTEK